ncbi:hypothetical protein VaNZ11_013835 [Volvox africanus]|uniref:Uncharacterized protein n=1 Tax=Volvox africanus TaxID=51714 RepID=A0ABQ5SH22_9CHLO|nr:hypothetical protein VaNZ11_013835 [Volvox africanus]
MASDDTRRSPLDTFAEDLGRTVLDAAASGERAPMLDTVLAGQHLNTDQIKALIQKTAEIKDGLTDYIAFLLGLLGSSVAATTSEGVGAQRAPVTPAVQEPVGIPEEPPSESTPKDQGFDRHRPMAAVNTVRKERRYDNRGRQSPSNRGSAGAGPSSGHAKGK